MTPNEIEKKFEKLANGIYEITEFHLQKALIDRLQKQNQIMKSVLEDIESQHKGQVGQWAEKALKDCEGV